MLDYVAKIRNNVVTMLQHCVALEMVVTHRLIGEGEILKDARESGDSKFVSSHHCFYFSLSLSKADPHLVIFFD